MAIKHLESLSQDKKFIYEMQIDKSREAHDRVWQNGQHL